VKNKGIFLLILISIAVLTVFLFIKTPETPKKAVEGNPIPDFILVDVDNNKVNLSDLRGSVVFINFWATWCDSCIEEMPSMERLYRRLSGNPNFKMATIIVKDDLNNALSFLKKNGYTFPVYLNPDESASRIFRITGIPETFILDKKGILRAKAIGPENWDSPQIFANIQELINEL